MATVCKQNNKLALVGIMIMLIFFAPICIGISFVETSTITTGSPADPGTVASVGIVPQLYNASKNPAGSYNYLKAISATTAEPIDESLLFSKTTPQP